MRSTDRPIDPLPDEFKSQEEAAEFWDRHSITDYEEFLEPVEVDVDIQRRHFEIEVDEETFGLAGSSRERAEAHERTRQRNPQAETACRLITTRQGIAGQTYAFTNMIKRSGAIDCSGRHRRRRHPGGGFSPPGVFRERRGHVAWRLPYNGSWACVVRLRPAICSERGRLPDLVCRSLDDFGRRRAHEPDTAREQYGENQSPDVCQGGRRYGPDRRLRARSPGPTTASASG